MDVDKSKIDSLDIRELGFFHNRYGVEIMKNDSIFFYTIFLNDNILEDYVDNFKNIRLSNYSNIDNVKIIDHILSCFKEKTFPKFLKIYLRKCSKLLYY